MSALRELLAATVAHKASDLHLKPGRPPIFRIHAELVESDTPPLTAAAIGTMVHEILPDHLEAHYRESHEADFSLAIDGVGRFRVNAFQSTGEHTMVFRHVKSDIPGFRELHLPPILQTLSLSPRGVILAAGTTGSGKSTTLAAMVEFINANLKRRIVTVEDPVEYVFQDKQSVISQREIGIDTADFHSALKRLMRQDPDVIMIGEMRDAESFLAALAAAETGHLVFSTLHAGTASQAIPRILDLFPSSEREQLRMGIAENLRAVFCQRLIPSIHGGVRPAVEVLINTPIVRKLLEKNILEKLPAAIETGNEDGMQTFNQSLYKLIRSGEITEELGMRFADNPESLRMNLKGIFLDEARKILSA